MRILWWQESFGPRPGGLRIVGDQVMRRLRQRGHQLAVITQDAELAAGHDDADSMPVWRLPFWQALSSRRIDDIVAVRRRVDAMAGEVAADVVHMNGFGPSALFCLESAQVAALPLVLALHSSHVLAAGSTTLARQLLERADWVTACSASLLDAALAAAPSIAGRASVVHNGVEAPPLMPAGLPDPPRLLCLGDLLPHKGFDLVIRALPGLRRRCDGLRLLIAGDGTSREEWQLLARREGVADAIEFLGFVRHAEVARLINAATVVVIPSRRESFSLVAVEAALMARPVVATRVDGLPEVVADGETGLLVDPDDVAGLEAAIGTLLGSPAVARRLGAAAREHALRHFTLERQVEAFETAYQRAVAARREVAANASQRSASETPCR